MSSASRRALLIGGAILALAAGGGLFWLRGRPKPSVTSPSSVAFSASATASSPPAPVRELVYDCGGLVSPSGACPASPRAGAAIVEVARWVSANAVLCGALPRAADWNKRVDAALAGLNVAELSKLPVIDRVIVQNAALRIAICSAHANPADQARRIKARVRELIQRIAPTRAELDALEGASKAQLLPWVGEAGSWKIRTGATRMHSSSEGFTFVHERLARDHEHMNVARVVAVDADGALRSVDVVAKLSVLRYGPSRVEVCLAETRPGTTGCGAPGMLYAVPLVRGAELLRGSGGPPCWGCHSKERELTQPSPPFDLERELAELKQRLEAP